MYVSLAKKVILKFKMKKQINWNDLLEGRYKVLCVG